MVDKSPLVMDSVRRLVRLKVTDKEIISYLQNVGFSEQQAVEVLAEAKTKEGVKEEIVERAPAPAPREKVSKSARATSKDLTRLWEKGIIVTVNDKLDEMKKVRKDLDKVLDKKNSPKSFEKAFSSRCRSSGLR